MCVEAAVVNNRPRELVVSSYSKDLLTCVLEPKRNVQERSRRQGGTASVPVSIRDFSQHAVLHGHGVASWLQQPKQLVVFAFLAQFEI